MPQDWRCWTLSIVEFKSYSGRSTGRIAEHRLGASPTKARRAIGKCRRVALSAVLLASTALLLTTVARADYAGSLTVRVFLDPDTIPAIIDGYDVGDEISYIQETTPRDTGSGLAGEQRRRRDKRFQADEFLLRFGIHERDGSGWHGWKR